jgi:polysaccharide chain length determinant protein (PEP-CTERM system associated)
MDNVETNNPETSTPEKILNIHDYLEIAFRRKWYILFPLVCSILVSFGVYKYLPKAYKATTLILVQAQSIPENYVRSTITDSVVNRLNTISQEILSRTRLEKVIQEFNLYADLRNKVPMEEAVEMMRKSVEVKVQEERNERRQNSFTISFEGGEPRTVMMVTNKLASLFIEENLRVRELQAEETSDFISKELQNTEDQLKRKEYDVRGYRERNMGQLPQQMEANLRILEQTQQQLRTVNEKIRAAEDRSMIFQGQIEQMKKSELQTNRFSGQEDADNQGYPEDPLVSQLSALKKDLAIAQTKLKETHPDMIDLRRRIAVLESQLEGRPSAHAEREGIGVRNLPSPRLRPDAERLYTQFTEQYHSTLLEAKRLKEEEKNLKEQMNLYQRRIEDTPKREQELLLLTRDYDQLKSNYQSLLDKKMQAQMAGNLERRQKGMQFKVLDPAALPEKPVKPDRNKILLIGAVFGLAIGLGLTWFRESLDQSFRTVTDLEDYLAIPVLARVPNLKEEKKAA